ncbi:Tyrosine recombinase XerD [termite gut metagenome]|uniref:Tyrosine recombinase XerD n=1 Tax=termite gut metagenome TaxID=433724 RepID=A0A5J4RTZ6_9ZZZZ
MKNTSSIMKYEYEGLLANLCESFIAEKRAIGCIYNTEAKHLREFSRFTCEFTFSENTLPAEVAQAWYTKRVMDSDRNRYARFALVKLFAEYMQRNGYEAYIPTKNELGRLQWSYTPYIFTHEEIHLFFASIDTLKLNRYSAAPQRHIIMPVLFRMLYCCGLRVSEATNLQVKDVSLPDGVLIVRESKFGKTRYIPMSEELTSLCKNYAENKTTGDNNYFSQLPMVTNTGIKLFTVFLGKSYGKPAYPMVVVAKDREYMIFVIRLQYTVLKRWYGKEKSLRRHYPDCPHILDITT